MSEQSDFQYYCPRRERTIYFDYYHLLDILPTASDEDIKKAYRKLALKYHPDKSLAEAKYVCKEKFKIISDAYATLIDPSRRCLYNSFMKCMTMKRNLKKCDVQGVSSTIQSCKINELMNMFLFQNLGRCQMGNNYNQSCGSQYSNSPWNFQNLNQKINVPTNHSDQQHIPVQIKEEIPQAFSQKLNKNVCLGENPAKYQDSNASRNANNNNLTAYAENQIKGMSLESDQQQQEEQEEESNCLITPNNLVGNEAQDSRMSDIKQKLNFISSCQNKSAIPCSKENVLPVFNPQNITLQYPNLSLFSSSPHPRTNSSDLTFGNTFSSNKPYTLLLSDSLNIPSTSSGRQQPISLHQNHRQQNEPANIEQEECPNINSKLELEAPQSERSKDLSSTSPVKCKSLITKSKIKTQFKSYCKSIQIIHKIQKKKQIFSLIKMAQS